jgi:hypothetical protein
MEEGVVDLRRRLACIEEDAYSSCIANARNVRRVPLKPSAVSDEEAAHLAMSSDGLRFFHPYQIHSDNCQETRGLPRILKHLSDKYKLGSSECGRYAILNVDVSLYYSIMLIIHSFGGCQLLRQNLVLFFGIWHPYLYAHTALWGSFRSTFLASAYFRVIKTRKSLLLHN